VSSGLFLSASYINQDNDTAGRDDTTLYYVQAGISKNWTGLGKTVLYGEYARVENGAENFSNPGFAVTGVPAISTTAEVWGLGVVQHIDAAAMELFLSYRKYSAGFDDIPSAILSINDFDMVVGGARIKF
jgi:predicted porin